jgi:RNA polymerase sigma factor for flagellar operon FliA
MGLELNEYHKILQDATGCRIFSFEDPGSVGEDGLAHSHRQPNQPLENLQNCDFKQGLAGAIKGLPERERLVMALYYDEELNLREIGEILGVSESRVCQIHGQALIRLRARMEKWLTD